MGKEVFRAVFKGSSASTNTCLLDDDKLFVRVSNRYFPLFGSWRFVAGNVTDRLKVYEEIDSFNISEGERGPPIRFYPFSLEDFEDNYSQINTEIIRELESNKAHCSFLSMLVSQLKDTIDRAGISDMLQEDVLRNHNFYVNQLKPLFTPQPKAVKLKKT